MNDEKEAYNSQDNLREIFHGLLPSQASIYSACQINGGEIEGRYDRVLLSSLLKDFRVYSCLNPPEIDIREKMYSYLPQGCEIVSVDVFRAYETPFELMTGITWMACQEDEELQPSYFFNIYESGLHYDVISLVDSIELDFVPYQLTHAVFGNNNDNTCFVINGSDRKCHVFFYAKEDHSYSIDEDYLALTFPELVEELPSVALWIAFDYSDDLMKRFTAIAHECGTVTLYSVDVASIKVLDKRTAFFEGPVTRVMFFQHESPVFGNDQPNTKSGSHHGIRLVALASLALSKVYYNVDSEGLSKSVSLPMSDEFDVGTCGLLADLDFDKKQEIVIGTYGEELLVYKSSPSENGMEKWTLQWNKSFNNPIHCLFHLDLTGDGIKELLIVTTRTVIVLQHDPKKVQEHLEESSRKSGLLV